MTTEFVLLLSLYAFILLGVFLGERGPIATFNKSAPRLAAIIERDLSNGYQFKDKGTGKKTMTWEKPERRGGN